jgi:hypothetical protein
MTLIVKELTIKGNVIGENSSLGEFSVSNDELIRQLEQMKKDIEKDCVEKVLQKLEARIVR